MAKIRINHIAPLDIFIIMCYTFNIVNHRKFFINPPRKKGKMKGYTMLRTIIAVAVVFSAIAVSAQSYTEISPERIRHYNSDNFPDHTYGKTAPAPTLATTFTTTTAPKTIAEISKEYAEIIRETSKSAGKYLEARAIRNATAKKPQYNLQALRTVCRDENLVKIFAYGRHSTKEIVKQELADREAKEELKEYAGND
ncbi:MAG: hypothetical protein WC415_02660 [Patescibacteria group bacterium]|jgi:hypothetical protein